MNIRSIGPNLFLSQNGDLGDGEMEVVLLPEEDKGKFAAYIQCKLTATKKTTILKTLRLENITISWDGTHVHADDEVLKIKDKTEVNIEVKPGLLYFLVP